MTGLHTGHTPVRGNAGKLNRKAQELGAETATMAGVLQKAGYQTALIGKWGLGQEGGDSTPNQKGFDYFYGYLDQHHAHNAYTDFVMRNGERVALRNKIVPGTGGKDDTGSGAGIAVEPLDFVPDLMTGEVLKWVEEKKEKPFFLYWSLITPHANNEGTKHGRGQEIPELGEYAAQPWPKPDQAHAATIARLDADVGRLLAKLKELGLDENTLVIFSSDNGHHKEGGNNPELFDANGPLRGMKRFLYEGGIRVPTMARWPGKVRAGVEEKRVLWFADILPTFAHLGGAHESLPAKLDGISFASLLLNLPHTPAARGDLYWEFHEGGFSQAVLMDSRWKAIRFGRLDQPVEIYDLENDLGEDKDLTKEKPELVARAQDLFKAGRTETADWPIKEAKAGAGK
jgi:arylsulfatase A-like enzyme